MIDHDGTLLGIVTAADIEQAIGGARNGLTAGNLVHEVPELRVDQSLEDAVRALAIADDEGLPVLDADGRKAIGWLTHRRLLRAYHLRLDDPPETVRAAAGHPHASEI